MPRHSADFQQLLNQRVEEFVAEITELARRHAVDTLSRALATSSAAYDTVYRQLGGNGRTGSRRTSGELEQQASTLMRFIEQNPGKRAEEIAGQVGMTTKDLSLPLKKLLDARMIKTEGQKRATRYFASSGGGGGGGGSGAAAGSGKKSRGRRRRKSG